jgi:hypothetical protein
MAPEQLKRRALHRAFYMVGSPEALAGVLRLPQPELAKLLGGKKEIPNAVFLAAVEFILGHPEAARLERRFDETSEAPQAS